MSLKVLLVDDITMFLEVQKGFLQTYSLSLLTARNGEEALELCRKERPSIVFMDLHMPVMNGAECCRAIKEDKACGATPVVLITSEGKDGDKQICLEAGCERFLTKPLQRTLYLDALRSLVPTIKEQSNTRVNCRIPVKFRILGATLSGTITDISQTGLYVSSKCTLLSNSLLEVVFALPMAAGGVIQARARVAWVNSDPSIPPGFGVEFIALPETARNDLAVFIRTQSELAENALAHG